MATRKKTVEVDYSMYEKIMALYELQKVDSQIDEINKVKGELPLEIEDLEDEIAGLNTRTANIDDKIEELKQLSRQREREIDEMNIRIARYREHMNNIRNVREHGTLEKEITESELNITLAQKFIREYDAAIKAQGLNREDVVAKIADREIDLKAKREELESIDADTKEQVDALLERAADAKSKIDERLLVAYDRIRSKVHNGLAVVTIQRDACSGCFNRIPPQRQVEVNQGKKLIVCEYCGRILVPTVEE